MKKLIMIALAACSITAFSITADEALASKNYYVINDYCKTNNMWITSFLCKSNSVDITYYKDVYNSCTNNLTGLKIDAYVYYSKSDADTLEYVYEKNIDAHRYCYGFIENKLNHINWLKYEIKTESQKYHNYALFMYELTKEDVSKHSKFEELKIEAINFDIAMQNNTLKDILYPRVKDTDYSVALDLAIAYNDVDKIIDALLKYSDLNLTQAEAIIKPLNSVDAEYRKDDILKALKNVNSKCTIKLYDDQKNWEPIISKIRAMISVRQ